MPRPGRPRPARPTAARRWPSSSSASRSPSKRPSLSPLRRPAQERVAGDGGVLLMEQRALGRTGRSVGVVGLGSWQLGAEWGEVSERDALDVLDAAEDAGITFIDTADVYGDGRSERLCGRLLRRRAGAALMVATKMGRRAPEQIPESYNLASFLDWNDRSRRNLGVDTIDLVQLHTPPSAVYSSDAVFDGLDELVAAGRIRAYGVSVETCAQALQAIERARVATVQIILNCFRLKPLEEGLPAARRAGAGIIARVPLASGPARRGVGGVTRGPRSAKRGRATAAGPAIPPLSEEQLAGVGEVYDRRIRPHVHDRW